MVEKLWIDLCGEHADVLEGCSSAPVKAQPDETLLSDAVQVFLAYASLLERAQKRLLVHAAEGRLVDATATGHMLFGLIHRALTSGKRLIGSMEQLRAARHIPNGVDDLGATKIHLERSGVEADPGAECTKCLDSLQDLLKVHTAGWPWLPAPTRAEAVAAHERGESMDLVEAFARIAGVSREAWLQRVESSKKQHQAQAS